MTAYYNESNAHAAEWLRNLASAGLICPGDIDDRDIRDVCANDLKGYTQHHFFAGIGIWSLALRMAGWPDDRPVTTGSCPCQPFSGAGKGDGFDDERHLWPAWHWLIQQYRPDTIFGEQVAGKDGGPWLDLVSSDLETLAYTFAPVVLPVAGLGAPNIRHRLFWLADANNLREQRRRIHGPAEGVGAGARAAHERSEGLRSTGSGMADTEGGRRGIDGLFGQEVGRRQDTRQPAFSDEAAGCGLADTGSQRCGEARPNITSAGNDLFDGCGANGDGLGDASISGLPHAEPSIAEGSRRRDEGRAATEPSGPCDPWRELEWIACLDGKQRPTQPGLSPLATRHPGDVGKLRAYGNAISPQIAAEVIKAYMDCCS